MMSKLKHIILSALATAACCGVAQAQTAWTPYSKIGYGVLNDNVSSIQRSMGGVGYAMRGGRIVNAMNPASYAQVDSLTFLWDIGVDFSNQWAKENNGNSGYNFGGGLDYITGHFRVMKGLGASFGLLPYSSVGYSYGNTLDNGTETRAGSGGLNQFYVGAGYEPIKGLSVGANVAYLFGTLSNTTLISSTSTSYFTRNMKVRDWNLQLGAQYSMMVNTRDRVTVGMMFQPKKSFHGDSWGTTYDSQDSQVDTVGFTSMSGNYEQPATIGLGVSYTLNRKLTAEVDYTYQQWSKAKYATLAGFESSTMQFDDRWRLAGGVQYTPNRRGSYVGAMTFRAGAFYNHDYLNIAGNNVRDYGLTVGVGLPAPSGKTTVNLGLEWRHRESSPTKLITENYFNITLGVNFNELWFWKSRIR